jgi:hypothetical protein
LISIICAGVARRPRDKSPIADVLLCVLLVLKTPKTSHVRFEQFSETCPTQSRPDRIVEGSEKGSIAGAHFSAPIKKNSKGQGRASAPKRVHPRYRANGFGNSELRLVDQGV